MILLRWFARAGRAMVATRAEGKMEKSDGLTVTQQRLVPIAAFTASATSGN